ncbi:MAG: recombinase family protein [Rhodobacteraceae bacterium]|nr:recombinase family protein [Paracoccaceae bacterium]
MIHEAFEGFASGRFGSQAEVRRFFELHPDFPRNKKGEIPNQRVSDVLNNPLYTGHICSKTYGIDWLKGQHKALISIDLFDKVQDRLNGSAKVLIRKNIGNDFAARGFVSCGDCGGPLSSSWSKGRDRSYAYYLCQAKGCASYGKSIPRDMLEGDMGALIKTLQPSQNLFELVKVMFREAWTQRLAQAEDIVKSGKSQIKAIEKQVDALLGRIIDTTNPTVIRAYEGKISDLERSKTKLQDQLAHHIAPASGTFEEKLEPALQFLASPWKLWESGQISLRRMVL